MPDLDLHHKPTPEELDEGIRKATEEAEKLSDNPDEEEEVVVVSPTEDTDEDENEPPKSDDEEEVKPSVEEQDKPDYKEKFTQSTREAQILAARNKKFNEAVDAADGMGEVTEDDLKQEALIRGFEVDDMTVVEKTLFKSGILNERKLAKISEVAKEGRDIEAWNQNVDTYIDDPKTLIAKPELEGKIEEFKVFATKPTRRGVDFDTLVSSFLWEAEQQKVKHKGNMFERGSGGANEKPNPQSTKLTVEQGAALQQTNYKKWKEYLMAGKIAEQ